MVWITSSGGVPSNSVIIENWLTSDEAISPVSGRDSLSGIFLTHGPFLGKGAFLPTFPQRYNPYSKCQLREEFADELPSFLAWSPLLTCDIVLLPRQHDFRGSVISGRHVSGHLGILNSGQTKVTDLRRKQESGSMALLSHSKATHLQVTVLVHQNVTRLQVSVHNTGGMDVFETTLNQTKQDELRRTRGHAADDLPISGTRSTG